ncbi:MULTISPECIES: DUF6175 family protein [Chryseobacterium]|uniref:DUF6175 family protein n=1 Tax=Chryseobacterium sp. R2A-55 TaxID=2744445 RepID=UPI001F1DB62A|nr:DUF6175 family protein [Chryseobacterium sp. R2A-55]
MKKKLLPIALVLIAQSFFAQGAKKPILMLFPEDTWCTRNGFMEKDGNGEDQCNYTRAFKESDELTLVMSKIGEIFTDRTDGKFNIRAFAQNQKIQSKTNARAALEGKDGSQIKTSAVNDLVSGQSNFDLGIYVNFYFAKEGPKNSLKFDFNAKDNYTGEQVASSPDLVGKSTYSSDILSMVAETINNKVDPFFNQIENYFTDMAENGRKAQFVFGLFNDMKEDFETEINGQTLDNHIEDWFASNAVKGKYNLTESSEVMLNFEEVRIPVFDANGRAVSADIFARGIKKTFEAAPYNFKVTVKRTGMGKTSIYFSKK